MSKSTQNHANNLDKLSTPEIAMSIFLNSKSSSSRLASSQRTIAALLPFAIAALVISFLPRIAYAFDYFEHRAVGSVAFERALQSTTNDAVRLRILSAMRHLGICGPILSLPNGLENCANRGPDKDVALLLQNHPIQFGDLSAMAGDIAKDQEELYNILRDLGGSKDDAALYPYIAPWGKANYAFLASRMQLQEVCRWLRTIYNPTRLTPPQECTFAIFESNASDLGPVLHPYGSPGYPSSRTERALFEAIEGYTYLASRNRDHFPRHSWVKYALLHRDAILLAKCSILPNQSCVDVGQDALTKALLVEGFAQHFLQDSFASGHIGAHYGKCRFKSDQFLCLPTKENLQHAHDTLNRIGLNVRIETPPEFATHGPEHKLSSIATSGITAFGDRHLLIPEAKAQRMILVNIAALSIKQVFASAEGSQVELVGGLFDARAFPVPTDATLIDTGSAGDINTNLLSNEYVASDLAGDSGDAFDASRDPRIPPLLVEGWKIGSAYVIDTARRIVNGKLGSGNVVSHGIALQLEYSRYLGGQFDTYGFEYRSFPRRGSDFLVSVGAAGPKVASLARAIVKFQSGVRIYDPNTPTNESSKTIVKAAIGVSIEAVLAVYRPVNLVIQYIPYRYQLSPSQWMPITKSPSAFIGLKLDLADVN